MYRLQQRPVQSVETLDLSVVDEKFYNSEQEEYICDVTDIPLNIFLKFCMANTI